jgi:hypothetical protein
MLDATTFSLSLTFIGTLGVALLIFVVQLASFAVLFCLAATVQLLAVAFRVLKPSPRRSSSKVMSP